MLRNDAGVEVLIDMNADRQLCVGRAGSALALLAPHETAYVEFLRLRRVPLAELDAAAILRELPSLGAAVRAMAEADRDVMEKGTRAFVSWVSPADAAPPLQA